MLGFVQSLNVSVATAMILWEITRQRQLSGIGVSMSKKEQKALLDDFIDRAK